MYIYIYCACITYIHILHEYIHIVLASCTCILICYYARISYIHPRTYPLQCNQCPQGEYIYGNCNIAATKENVCKHCREKCDPGSYISGQPCSGLSNSDTTTCERCKSACPPGFYMQGNCTGTSFTDTVMCIPCKSTCGLAGWYLSGSCPGTNTTDSITCLQCKTTCAYGQYLSGQTCTGSSFSDTVTCTNCKTACDAGKYLSGYCPGYNRTDTVECAPCRKSCPASSYLSHECTGLSYYDASCIQCRTCYPGTYMQANSNCTGKNFSDSVTCAYCKQQCLPGEYLAGYCYGNSNYDTVSCIKCTQSCPQGYYMWQGCSGMGRADDVRCTRCGAAQCAPGYYIANGCNGSSFSDQAVCSPCLSTCPRGYYMQGGNCSGSSFTDTTACVACKTTCSQGWYLSGTCPGTSTTGKTCLPCRTSCPPSTYLVGTCPGNTDSDLVCAPCRSCPAGMYASETCTGLGNSDTVECTPCTTCKAGTYKVRAKILCAWAGSYVACTCACSIYHTDTHTHTHTHIHTHTHTQQVGACTGDTASDTIACIPCKTCVSWQTPESVCDGSGSKDTVTCGCGSETCGVGFFMPSCNKAECTRCKGYRCSPGQYAVGTCAGNGYVDLTYCVDCVACPEGYYASTGCTGTGRTDTVTCSPCKTVCPDGRAPTGFCSGSTAVDVTKCGDGDGANSSSAIMFYDSSQAVMAVTVELAMSMLEFGYAERNRFTAALKSTAKEALEARITSVYETQNSSIVRRSSHETRVHIATPVTVPHANSRSVPLTLDDDSTDAKLRAIVQVSETQSAKKTSLSVTRRVRPAEIDKAEAQAAAAAASQMLSSASDHDPKAHAGSGKRNLKLRGKPPVRKLSSMSVVIRSEVVYPNTKTAVFASQSITDAALNSNLVSYGLPEAKITQRPVLVENSNPPAASSSSSAAGSGANIGVAIGGAVAGALGLALICLGAVVYHKYKKRVRLSVYACVWLCPWDMRVTFVCACVYHVYIVRIAHVLCRTCMHA